MTKEEPCILHKFELFSYEKYWEGFKKEFNLTDEEAIEQVTIELQLLAWADIITQRIEYLRRLKPKELRQELGK